MVQPGEKKIMMVDVGEFVRTRDALSSAYMSLSHSIDKAVKAYIDHTNVVLGGGDPLDVALLSAPIDQLPRHAAMAQQALQHGLAQMPQLGNSTVSTASAKADAPVKEEKKKKRAYKQRDPNAPKRPLTAYFRYLQEQRGPLGEQMAAQNDGVVSKPGDLSKAATERWNALSKPDQQPYRDQYQAALKDYEKAVALYKAEQEGGPAPAVDAEAPEVDADADAEDDAAGEDVEVEEAAVVGAAAKAEASDSDDSTDDDSSDDDVIAPPPPPPAPVEKTPKSSMKKGKQSVPPTPVPSNIDPGLTASTPSAAPPSSSPELKRKALAVSSDSAEAETGTKKKRGRPTKAEAAAKEAATAPPSTDEPAKKKRKKKTDA